ncbi:unnamed protein product [Oppiella nova]|uniref:Uncharacterized protein n=1 Tax=Oppiella nova TaxID=334625 RepID=A0A7R9QLH7_9ACAR|nr:unnamed protein product [Oppiella nova]CAG2167675.1 unnamed protein product [Oppiella nova]
MSEYRVCYVCGGTAPKLGENYVIKGSGIYTCEKDRQWFYKNANLRKSQNIASHTGTTNGYHLPEFQPIQLANCSVGNDQGQQSAITMLTINGDPAHSYIQPNNPITNNGYNFAVNSNLTPTVGPNNQILQPVAGPTTTIPSNITILGSYPESVNTQNDLLAEMMADIDMIFIDEIVDNGTENLNRNQDFTQQSPQTSVHNTMAVESYQTAPVAQSATSGSTQTIAHNNTIARQTDTSDDHTIDDMIYSLVNKINLGLITTNDEPLLGKMKEIQVNENHNKIIVEEIRRELKKPGRLIQFLDKTGLHREAIGMAEMFRMEEPWPYTNGMDLKVINASILRSGSSRYFPMNSNPRGRAIVFVTVDGLDVEIMRWKSIFGQLGFQYEVYREAPCSQIRDVLLGVSCQRFVADALFVMVIGRGFDQKIYGYGKRDVDNEMSFTEIVDIFSSNNLKSDTLNRLADEHVINVIHGKGENYVPKGSGVYTCEKDRQWFYKNANLRKVCPKGEMDVNAPENCDISVCPACKLHNVSNDQGQQSAITMLTINGDPTHAYIQPNNPIANNGYNFTVNSNLTPTVGPNNQILQPVAGPSTTVPSYSTILGSYPETVNTENDISAELLDMTDIEMISTDEMGDKGIENLNPNQDLTQQSQQTSVHNTMAVDQSATSGSTQTIAHNNTIARQTDTSIDDTIDDMIFTFANNINLGLVSTNGDKLLGKMKQIQENENHNKILVKEIRCELKEQGRLTQFLNDTGLHQEAIAMAEMFRMEEPWPYGKDLKVINAKILRSGNSRYFSMDSSPRGRAIVFVTVDGLKGEVDRWESIFKQLDFRCDVYEKATCSQINDVLLGVSCQRFDADALLFLNDTGLHQEAIAMAEMFRMEEPWPYGVDLKVINAKILRSGNSRYFSMDSSPRGRAIVFVTVDGLKGEVDRWMSIFKQLDFRCDVYEKATCSQINDVLLGVSCQRFDADALLENLNKLKTYH